MRLSILLFSILFYFVGFEQAQAQTTLVDEKFDNCILPANWQLDVTGNPNVQWYVGVSQNAAAPNQSIDGSCFLFIDDNNAGNNTPGYVLDFYSPSFNTANYEKVELSMDVHYRHRAGTQQSLDILITDGNAEYLLTRFDQTQSNSNQISDFYSLKYDLSLITHAPNVHLIIRYKDSAGEWGWWAGIDNVKIVGSGTGTMVLGETFNDCSKPAGWETTIVNGQDNWRFGKLPSTSAAYNHGTSMDGSCFAFFDDDDIGGQAPPSTVRLTSPWFTGIDFFKYTLSYDLILRFGGENIAVYLETDQGTKTELFKSTGHVGGPWFPDYVHMTHDLSPYRAVQMRLVFEYSDEGVFGYWVGLDNVKVVGQGEALDFCDHAKNIFTDTPCEPDSNTTALFDGPPAECSGRAISSLWYRWFADFTGIAELRTNSNFNEIVNIYTNICTNPAPVLCNNRDEHGFTGETTYFQVTQDETYFIRVSGQADGFGYPHGNVCVEINQVDNFPLQPSNEDCATAISLGVDAPCLSGSNKNADMSTVIPKLNELARADVWYKFTATNHAPGDIFEIKSNANFSDIITAYSGTCNSLMELASNHEGENLELTDLTAGQQYYVQIAGTFATVEGNICPTVSTKSPAPVANDSCLAAIPVTIGNACEAGFNSSAGFSGYQPPCAVSVDRDIWFKFTAPDFGSVQINTGATFEHTLAIWEGDCNGLEKVFCAKNPLRCDGYVTVGSLKPDQTYYVQIASWNGAGGIHTGNVCLKILDGQTVPDFSPLELNVLQPCVGVDSARLSVEIKGGLMPYTFIADKNGQVITSGEPFAVIVVDGMGCEAHVFGTAAPCASNACTAVASIQVEQPDCPGDTNGSLLATVTGAGSQVEYQWSNGVHTANNPGLTAGTYTLTISEPNGCVEVLSATISTPPAFVLSALNSGVSCFGNANGSIQLTVSGGTPGYTYLWSNNQTTKNLSNLVAGMYTVTVTDINGCTATKASTVTQPPLLQLASTPTAISCFGSANGSIDLTVSGGTTPYKYLWSGGQTIQDLNNLSAGNYTVTVTDARNCTQSIMATITEPPVLEISLTPSPASCAGVSDGSITLEVTGGAPPYNYEWSGPVDPNNLPAGTYTITVTDLNNCETTASATVLGAPDFQLETVAIPVTCFGETDGAINIEISGGTPGYTFLWAGGQTSQNLSSLSGGQYTVTITDTENCTVTKTVLVPEPAELQSTLTANSVSCNGFGDGTILQSISGGTADYNFNWSNGESTQDLMDIAPGTYTVTITDLNACSLTLEASITEPDVLVISTDNIQQPVVGQNNGSIQISMSGGTQPFQYSWYLNGTTLISNLEDPENLSAGQYSLFVVDQNGCEIGTFYILTEIVSTGNPQHPEFEVLVFPNPAKEFLNVSVTLPSTQTIQVFLCDPLGRTVRHKTVDSVSEQQFEIQLGDLPAGMYVLRIMGDRDQVSRNVVISR